MSMVCEWVYLCSRVHLSVPLLSLASGCGIATGLCVSNNMSCHDDDQLAVIVHSCSLCRVYTFLTITFNSQAKGLSVLTHCQVVSELLCPDCTLHTALTHMITVLERESVTFSIYTIGIHVRFHHFICCNHVSGCSVQGAIWTIYS